MPCSKICLKIWNWDYCRYVTLTFSWALIRSFFSAWVIRSSSGRGTLPFSITWSSWPGTRDFISTSKETVRVSRRGTGKKEDLEPEAGHRPAWSEAGMCSEQGCVEGFNTRQPSNAIFVWGSCHIQTNDDRNTILFLFIVFLQYELRTDFHFGLDEHLNSNELERMMLYDTYTGIYLDTKLDPDHN